MAGIAKRLYLYSVVVIGVVTLTIGPASLAAPSPDKFVYFGEGRDYIAIMDSEARVIGTLNPDDNQTPRQYTGFVEVSDPTSSTGGSCMLGVSLSPVGSSGNVDTPQYLNGLSMDGVPSCSQEAASKQVAYKKSVAVENGQDMPSRSSGGGSASQQEHLKNKQACESRGGSWLVTGSRQDDSFCVYSEKQCEDRGGKWERSFGASDAAYFCNLSSGGTGSSGGGSGVSSEEGSGDCGVETSVITGAMCGRAGGGSAEGPIFSILLWVLNTLAVGVGVVAVGGVGYAAILYSSSRDSPDQVKKAKGLIINIAIGILLFGGTYILLNFLIPGGVFSG